MMGGIRDGIQGVGRVHTRAGVRGEQAFHKNGTFGWQIRFKVLETLKNTTCAVLCCSSERDYNSVSSYR